MTNHTSFKIEMTRDLITPHAGLALLGEFAVGLRLVQSVDKYLPTPGSSAGYHPSAYIFPLILMLNGSGRTLEDTRQIRADEGLREILPLEKIPSSDAFGDWLRNMGGQWKPVWSRASKSKGAETGHEIQWDHRLYTRYRRHRHRSRETIGEDDL